MMGCNMSHCLGGGTMVVAVESAANAVIVEKCL